jgi:hypothetical protein
MKSPGWGGFFMGMAFASSVLVIGIFLVEPFQALVGEVPYSHRINCSL